MQPKLRDLVCVEVDGMVVPEQRTMTMNFDQSMIDAITEEYEEYGKINRTMVAKTLNAGLNMSDKSWTPKLGRKGEPISLRRMRFHAHIEFDQCTRNQPGVSFMLCGFTGEIYDSDLKDIDERLPMYINQIIEYRTSVVKDRRGDEYVKYDVAKIILIQRKDQSERNRHHSARVEDILVYTDLEHSNLLGASRGRKDIVVTGSAFKHEGKAADFRELTRSTFMFKLLDSDYASVADSRTYTESMANPDLFGTTRYNDAARSYARTNRLNACSGMIHYLIQRNPEVGENGVFEYQDLIDLVDKRNPIYEDLCDITSIVPIAGNDIRYYSKEFYGKTAKMRSLAIACQEIPAMMSDYQLASISFTIDNENLSDGEAEFSINDFSAVVPMDGTEHMVDICMRRILSEVYNQISDDNRRYVYLRVDCRMGGMVDITMEYERNDPEEFQFPANMSGIFGSTSSYDRDNTYDNAEQYRKLSHEVIDRVVFKEEPADAPAGSSRWSE